MKVHGLGSVAKLFALLTLVGYGLAQAAIPASERQVLLDLYTSTNGASWTTSTGWNGAAGTECSWYGITCNSSSTNVNKIKLYQNNLTGSLPSSLSALPALTYFDVDTNALNGSIPTLSGLVYLSTFLVFDNQLSGTIPTLSGLTSLADFEVTYNNLSGPIPDLSGLTNLQLFIVGNNQLTGPIPSSLSGLTNMVDFETGYNSQLTGSIPSLSGLTNLQYFDISHSQLAGPIPSLFGLTNLRYFYVGNNDLTGDIPTAPATLLAGQSTLCPNALNHTADTAWDTATGVSPWYTNCTGGTGIPPSERAVLDAIYTQTNGASWTNRSGWEGAAGTECTWFGITCTPAGDHVTIVSLVTNNLTGSLPPISALTQLTAFTVYYNNSLGGPIPSLTGLTQLQTFWVTGNAHTGSIPDLSGLVNLQTAYFDTNHLTGSLPALAGHANLVGFTAFNNHLTGTIPSLAGLANLKDFGVYNNQLNGIIPALTGLSSLADFNVGSNQLTGNIPALTGLTSLQTLDAANNQLTGAIPSLAGLPLQKILVGNNNLSGYIPTAPATLLAGQSTLCNNALNHTTDAAWDTATGSNPWYTTCTLLPPTTTTLISSPNPSTLGATVTFTANVSGGGDLGPPNGTVTFKDGSTVLCNIAIPLDSSSAICNSSSLSVGTHAITASYLGDSSSAPSTSVPLTQTVTTTVGASSVTLLSSLNPSNVGDAVTFTATVSGNAPAGTVTFMESGAVALCNAVALSGGSASCPTSSLAAGTYAMSASYSGDSNNSASTSSTLIQRVNTPTQTGERAVLDALYTQTHGATWTNNTGWEGAAGTECSWLGITCNAAGDHITGISLPNNNLSGTLPSISSLTQLTTFVAAGNLGLGGSIPALSGLSALQTVSFAGNNHTGPVPDLSGLLNLQTAYFDSNHLTGSLPAFAGHTNLVAFTAFDNQLTGTIPPLTGLTNLQKFRVDSNQLSGFVPALTGLTSLQTFSVQGNQLTGNLPDPSGLINLQTFDASDNQLSGSIPALGGLATLTTFAVTNNALTGTLPALPSQLRIFQVGGNGLTGNLPAPPGSLQAGLSSLCNNALTPVDNGAWDAATGSALWYTTCTRVPATLSLTAADTTVATGTETTITVTLSTAPATALVLHADAANNAATASYGTVTITDAKGGLICYVTLNANGSGSCDVILPAGTTVLVATYLGTADITPASGSFSKTNPVTPTGNLNQFGWTGAWYDAQKSGQGFFFATFPSATSSAGAFSGSWFTFDTTSGGEDHNRWYTLQGPAASTSATTLLNIYATTGGNFNAGPVVNTANGQHVVGTATLNFSDCHNARLTYAFTDGSGRVGAMPLTRLDANVTCDPNNGNGNGTEPGKFLLSGAWYDSTTSGQGLVFDINSVQHVTSAAWYTFAQNGQAIGGGASQRWYTVQASSDNVGAAPVTVKIYSTTGGVFNTPGSGTTTQVGSGSLTYTSCSNLTLSYSFTAGSNSGLAGTMNLQRIGTVPAGCSL